MVENTLIGHLMYTGLSEYEARVYVAFLGKNPATAYEAAKRAGVPTSKVYETVARLEDKGVLFPFDDEEARTRRYVPQNPEEYMHGSRQIMNKTLDMLAGEFRHLRAEQPVSFVWNVADYDELMDRARRLIMKAGQTLLMSLWKDESVLLSGLISEAAVRGVKIACLHYGEHNLKAGQVFVHPIGETMFDHKGGRGVIVVADSGEALVGTVRDDGSTDGAHSTGRGFVDLAEDYVRHDIYMMKIITRFDPHLRERFGARYQHLQDIFNDTETL